MYKRQLREFTTFILYLEVCEQIAEQREQLLIYKPNGNIYAGCYSGKVMTECGEAFYYTMYSLYGKHADTTYITISTCGQDSMQHDFAVDKLDLDAIESIRQCNIAKEDALLDLYRERVYKPTN